MLIQLHRGQLTYFRAKARRNRNEIYAMLFGTRRGSTYTVEAIMYPELDVSTPFECAPDSEDYDFLVKSMKDEGLKLLGTLHSHPGAPAYMSPGDLRSHLSDGDYFSGIVEICGGRTRVSFWLPDTPVPCQWEYLS